MPRAFAHGILKYNVKGCTYMLFIFKELVPLVEFCLVFLVLGTIFVLVCENGLFWYALACVPFIVIIFQLKTNKCNKLTANQKKSNIRNNSVEFFFDNKHRTYYYDKENTRIYLNKGKPICTTTIYRQFTTDEDNIEQSAIFIMDLTSKLYLVKKDYPCALPYTGENNHHFKWHHLENDVCMAALFQLINNDFKTKINQPTKTIPVYSETEIRCMNWRSFEEFITNLFETNGYDAKTTPPTNDEGKDIIAVKDGVTYFIECKHWRQDSIIGREFLQKLVGAAVASGVKNIIFVATCTYNDNAKEYAQKLNDTEMHIDLWDMDKILSIANNKAT
jgi:HJR/Mrr/RecB family endonuclease